ncbi:GNAT family N-acetyltransferase [Thalassobacillus devorans]|uniref:GNAT family N-acetyltransferase n=1 Tax=Thalassobacillus devorans TaxID=279813 RepID=UPI001594E5EA|nr:GNAT family N-acetyltransferase [Thalassobacillus devorans]
MKITSHTHVDEQLAKEIRRLENNIKEYDGIRNEMYIADNLNFDASLPWVFTMHNEEELISVVTAFIPSKKEIELMGITHPGHRRNGYFSILEKQVYETWDKHNIPSLLYVLNEDSHSGKAVAVKREAVYQYTEFQMEYTADDLEKGTCNLEILRAGENDLEILAEIQERAFGLPREDARTFINLALNKSNHYLFIGYLNNTPVTMGAAAFLEEASSIYGVCVLPEHQGFGYGRELMVHLVKASEQLSDQKITLEVDSKNERAYQLYRKLGFVATTSTGYYRKSLI